MLPEGRADGRPQISSAAVDMSALGAPRTVQARRRAPRRAAAGSRPPVPLSPPRRQGWNPAAPPFSSSINLVTIVT